MAHFAPMTAPDALEVPPDKVETFLEAIDALDAAHTPYALGGGLALYYYTGIRREVHDLDAHLPPTAVLPAMQALRDAGFDAYVHHGAWLAQAWKRDEQIDLVFGQGSWHASVTNEWIARARPTRFLDRDVNVISPEHFIWSKALRCSRMRYDGPDLFHLIASAGHQLDWRYLIDLSGPDWEVLASHLVLFRYTYPSRTDAVPSWVQHELYRRLDEQVDEPWRGPPICRGGLLDTSGPFDQDLAERGYIDERERRWEERMKNEPVLHDLRREEMRFRARQQGEQ